MTPAQKDAATLLDAAIRALVTARDALNRHPLPASAAVGCYDAARAVTACVLVQTAAMARAATSAPDEVISVSGKGAVGVDL